MKPTPPGWPRMASAVSYEQPRAAIEWLCRAFGFELRLLVEGDGDRIEHSELVFGGGVIMISDQKAHYPWRRAPSQLDGANTQSMMVYVDDAETQHRRIAATGGALMLGKIETHDYGDDHWSDRGFEVVDPGGHHWWFFERLRTPGQ